LIAGLVVAGFGVGLHSAFAAAPERLFPTISMTDPAAASSSNPKRISSCMLVFALHFVIVLRFVTASQRSSRDTCRRESAKECCGGSGHRQGWKDMLGTSHDFILWLIYFAGGPAGLTFISLPRTLANALGEWPLLLSLCLQTTPPYITMDNFDKIGRQWTRFRRSASPRRSWSWCSSHQEARRLATDAPVSCSQGDYGSNLPLPSATKDISG
jgi:hypothetical protein